MLTDYTTGPRFRGLPGDRRRRRPGSLSSGGIRTRFFVLRTAKLPVSSTPYNTADALETLDFCIGTFLVPGEGIEPPSEGCKPTALPLS